MKAFICDARNSNIKYCIPGLRLVCEREGIDFRQILKEGIDISILEKLDNIMANEIIKNAKLRIQNEQK
jgi:hypothetical protein